MTHRAGEPFTIKSLKVIDEIFKTNDRINSTARGNVIGKFYEFITDYIQKYYLQNCSIPLFYLRVFECLLLVFQVHLL